MYRRIFYVIGAEGGLDPDTALGQTFIGVNLCQFSRAENQMGKRL